MGEPGGHATGVLCQSEERTNGKSDNSLRRSIARITFCFGWTKFAPRAMNASRFKSNWKFGLGEGDFTGINELISPHAPSTGAGKCGAIARVFHACHAA